jgi:hypothetical protein
VRSSNTEAWVLSVHLLRLSLKVHKDALHACILARKERLGQGFAPSLAIDSRTFFLLFFDRPARHVTLPAWIEPVCKKAAGLSLVELNTLIFFFGDFHKIRDVQSTVQPAQGSCLSCRPTISKGRRFEAACSRSSTCTSVCTFLYISYAKPRGHFFLVSRVFKNESFYQDIVQ